MSNGGVHAAGNRQHKPMNEKDKLNNKVAVSRSRAITCSAWRDKLATFKLTFADASTLEAFAWWLVAHNLFEIFLAADISEADEILARWAST